MKWLWKRTEQVRASRVNSTELHNPFTIIGHKWQIKIMPFIRRTALSRWWRAKNIYYYYTMINPWCCTQHILFALPYSGLKAVNTTLFKKTKIQGTNKYKLQGTGIPCTRCVSHTGYLAYGNGEKEEDYRIIVK